MAKKKSKKVVLTEDEMRMIDNAIRGEIKKYSMIALRSVIIALIILCLLHVFARDLIKPLP